MGCVEMTLARIYPLIQYVRILISQHTRNMIRIRAKESVRASFGMSNIKKLQ